MLKSLISYQTISLLAREMFNVMVQKIGSLEIQFPAAVDVKVLRLRLLLHISKAFAFLGMPFSSTVRLDAISVQGQGVKSRVGRFQSNFTL